MSGSGKIGHAVVILVPPEPVGSSRARPGPSLVISMFPEPSLIP